MSKCEYARCGSDVRKLLLAFVAVIAMISVAWSVTASDSSEADAPIANYKTYYRDSMSSAAGQSAYDAAVACTNDITDETIEGTPYKVWSFSVPIHTTLKGTTESELTTAYDQILSELLVALPYDRVDMFWLSNHLSYNMSYTVNDGKVVEGTVTFKFLNVVDDFGRTDTERAATLSKIETKTSTIPVESASTYTKVRSLHDAVINIVSYDNDKPDGMSCRNIATAFLDAPDSSYDHKVVCEGYARAFKYLCDQNNIPCILMSGDAFTSPSGVGEGHMWNYVQMDNGKWYLVDCTWDENDPSSRYLLAGSETQGPANVENMKVKDTHLREFYNDTNKVKHLFPEIPTISDRGFKEQKFTVTFLNYDGSIISTKEDYDFGDIPVVPTSVTYSNALIAETFTLLDVEDGRWEKIEGDKKTPIKTSIPAVTGDTVYKACYHIEGWKNYEYTFDLDNGTAPIVNSYYYGDPVVIPPTPTKASSNGYNYTFAGWDVTPDYTAGQKNDGVEPHHIKALYKVTYSTTVINTGFVLTETTLNEIKTAGCESMNVDFKDTAGNVYASISFDRNAIANLAKDQTLTVKTIDPETIETEVKDKLKNCLVYSIDFGENNTFSTSSVKGTATVTLAYTKDASSLLGMSLYYVNGNELQKMNCSFTDEKAIFDTDHFSLYAIQSNFYSIDWMWYAPIALILIFAAIGMALSYKFSGKR